MLLLPVEYWSICCCSVQSPTHLSYNNTFRTLSNKVRGLFFKRTVSARPYCVDYVSVYSFIRIMWLYNKKKRNDKESKICLTPKPSQSFFVYRIQSKEKKLRKKSFSKKRGIGVLNKKRKGFLTALVTVIKKDGIKLKVYEKTVKTDLSPDLDPL